MSNSSLPTGSKPGSAHPPFGGLHPAVLAVRMQAINTDLADARIRFDLGDLTSARILVKEAQAKVLALKAVFLGEASSLATDDIDSYDAVTDAGMVPADVTLVPLPSKVSDPAAVRALMVRDRAGVGARGYEAQALDGERAAKLSAPRLRTRLARWVGSLFSWAVAGAAVLGLLFVAAIAAVGLLQASVDPGVVPDHAPIDVVIGWFGGVLR